MLADKNHRDGVVIIYDRRNAGEDPTIYTNTLADALGTLHNGHFLIMPQVPNVGIKQAKDSVAAMESINKNILRRWPLNTFSQAEQDRFIIELSDPRTRVDGIHRGPRGQTIEAFYIERWLKARSW